MTDLHVSERTPEAHRAEVNAWRATAPANDSKILPRGPRADASPRHEALADELNALLRWKALRQVPESLSTNWCHADNDNDDPPEERESEDDATTRELPLTECEHEIRPSIGEMTRSLRDVEFRDLVRCADRSPYGRARSESSIANFRFAIGGDIETGCHGPTRLGGLRFSNGRAEMVGERMPAGAMTHYRAAADKRGKRVEDNFGTPKGADKSDDAVTASNDWLAATLQATAFRFIERSKAPHRKRAPNWDKFPPLPPTSMPIVEARVRAGLPPAANDNASRPALPCGSRSALESFIGLQVRPGKARQPINHGALHDSRLEGVEECARLEDILAPMTVKVLDTAICCQNFREIGESFGYKGKTAERKGQTMLREAVAELSVRLTLR